MERHTTFALLFYFINSDIVVRIGNLVRNGLLQASVGDLVLKYPQVYTPWSSDDDNKLEALYCEGKTVIELAAIFERNEGAITSRIKKLELVEKYS